MTKKIIVMLLLSAIAASCMREDVHELSMLRIGILPDQGAEELYRQYNPLFQHLSQELGVPFELTIPQNYAELLRLAIDKKLDLVYLGGVTFLKAHQEAGISPLVMRDIDTRFTSYFIVDAKNTASNLKEFKGKTISFGSKLSTSGHFMPRYFLAQQGITDPESYYKRVEYSAAHDKTVYKVLNKKVDLGAVNSIIVKQMLQDGRLDTGKIRILYRTPSYVDYVWAINPDIDGDVKIRIRDAFLKLSIDNPHYKNILEKVGALSFYPAGMHDFSRLQNVVRKTRASALKE